MKKIAPILFLTLLVLAMSISSQEEKTNFVISQGAYGPLHDEGKITFTEEELTWLMLHPKVVIAFDADFAPYSSEVSEGKFEGIAVDFVKELSKITGIEFEVYPDGLWKNLYQAALDREVDVVATMTPKPEREEFFEFSQEYITLDAYMITKNDVEGFDVSSDLEGKKVALVEGYSMSDIILEAHPDIIPVYVNSLSDSLKAVSLDEADVTVTAIGLAQHVMATEGFVNLRIKGLFKEDISVQAFGVRKDWSELASIIDKALDSMRASDKLTIFNNWISLPEKTEKISFTSEEQAWLDEHPVITIGGGIFPPFNFIDKQGNSAGMGQDYFDLLTQDFGINVNYISGNWNEIQKKAEEKEIDGLSILLKTEKRGEYLNWVGPVSALQQSIFTRKNAKGISSLEDLAHKRVCVNRATYPQIFIEDNYPDIDVVPLQDSGECLHALINNDVEAVVGSLAVNSYYVNENLISGLKVVGLPAEMERDLYLGIRKDWPELASMMNKVVTTITPRQHRQIQSNWIGDLEGVQSESKKIDLTPEEQAWIKDHPKINMGFNADMEPLYIVKNDGQVSGILDEVFDEIQELTGMKINIEVDQWSSIISKVKDKELDGYLTSVVGLAEESDLIYSNFIVSAMPVAYARTDAPFEISSEKDLIGKKVVYLKGTYVVEQAIESYGDQIELIGIDNALEMFQMVLEGEADVAFGLNFHNFLINKHLLLGIGPVYYSSKFRDGGVSSIRSDWPEYISIINKALTIIGQDRINEIVEKWTGTQEEERIKITLTPEEQAWLSEHRDEIQIGVDPNFAPFEFISEDGMYKGICADYIKLIADTLSLDLKPFPDVTWSEVIDKSKEQEINVLPCIGITDERKQWLLYTQPYLYFPRVIITRDDSAIETIEDLYNVKVGVHKDSSHHGYIKEQTDLDPILYDSFQASLIAVSAGEVDATIGNLAVSSYSIQEMNMANLKIAGTTSGRSFPLATGIRKDWPELVSIFNKVLGAIPQEKILEIHSKWVAVKYAEDLTTPISRVGVLEPRTFEQTLYEINHDLLILSFDRPLNNLLNEKNEVIKKLHLEEVKQDFLTFVNIKPRYYQLRYIDETGQEIVRINNDGENIYIVSDDELQNKANRYYFDETMALNQGEIYISPFDLNIERGKLENRGTVDDPVYVSVIRYGIPVFDDAGTKRGIVIINVYGDWIKDVLDDFTDVNNKYYLLDSDGYFIHEPKGQDEFGFMFDQDPTYKEYFGELSTDLFRRKSGNLYLEDNIYSFSRINPSEDSEWPYWVLIHETPFGEHGFSLSLKEDEWLSKQDSLSVGIDLSWPPYDYVDDVGTYQGICSDLVYMIAQVLDIDMDIRKDLNWQTMVGQAKEGNIDIIPCIVPTEDRSEYLDFTIFHTNLPEVIVTHEDYPSIDKLSDLEGETIALIKDFATVELIKKDYPGIYILLVNSPAEALSVVSEGKADGTIMPLITIKYLTNQLGIENLRVSIVTNYSVDLAFGVKKDNPELLSMLNKFLNTITEEDMKNIRDKWTTSLVETKIAWGVVAQVGLGIGSISGLVIGMILLVNVRLGKEIKKRKKVEKNLQKSNKLKDFFVDIMNHDLLNQVNIARLNSQMLLMETDNKERLKMEKLVFSSTDRTIKMIQNAHHLSKLQTGEKLEFSNDDLGKHMKKAIKDVTSRAKTKKIKIKDNLKGKYLAMINPLIYNVFYNLLTNAIKYSPENTVIGFDVSEKDGHYMISVSDNGEGIVDKHKKAVFERFQRMHKGAIKGSGLGLAITKKIMEVHKGKVWVENNPNGGSIFKVLIPRKK